MGNKKGTSMTASLLAIMAVIFSFSGGALAAMKNPTVIIVGAGMSGDLNFL